MEEFVMIITGFPTVIFSVGLVIVAKFWLLSLLGVVDIDVLNLDVEIDAETDAGEFGILNGFLTYFGLNGIPVTIVLSVLVLFAWLLSYFASAYILAPLPFDWLRYVAGAGLLIGCLMLAAPLASLSLKPTRHLYAGATAVSNSSFVGGKGVVSTLEVTESFGRAEVDDGGAGLLIDVRAATPNKLSKGSVIALLSYDEVNNAYEVMSDEEFMQL